LLKVYKLQKNSSEAESEGGREREGEGGRWDQIDTKAEMNLKAQKQE
jgi:hypothetical protein